MIAIYFSIFLASLQLYSMHLENSSFQEFQQQYHLVWLLWKILKDPQAFQLIRRFQKFSPINNWPNSRLLTKYLDLDLTNLLKEQVDLVKNLDQQMFLLLEYTFISALNILYLYLHAMRNKLPFFYFISFCKVREVR